MLVKTKNNCSSDIDVHWPSKLFLYSTSSLFNFVVLLTSFFSLLLFCMFRVAEAAYTLALQLHFYVVHSFISIACSLHCIPYLVSSFLVCCQSGCFAGTLSSSYSPTCCINWIWQDVFLLNPVLMWPNEMLLHHHTVLIWRHQWRHHCIVMNLSNLSWPSPHFSFFITVLFVLLYSARIDFRNIALLRQLHPTSTYFQTIWTTLLQHRSF